VASPIGLQRWRRLLFLHWAVPAERLRPLVPAPLALDTFEGTAYVGLIPFVMTDVRPLRFLPPIPTAAAFLECNLRTYVTLDGEPGVWFFSLDASSTLAVLGARAGFGLPYFRARMSLDGDEADARYRSRRFWPPPTPANLQVRYTAGAAIGPAAPGTLEHFQVERYLLYARHLGRLVRGRVRHPPYPLRRATVHELREDLVAAAGIRRHPARTPDLYSDGVDVEIFAPTSVR
jgi:uncharacterized protein